MSKKLINTYDIENETYLGAGKDAAHHSFHAFLIDKEIHIVYSLGQQNQHVAKADIEKVSRNIDDYIWTPFAQFSLTEFQGE
ncbi:MAG: hypothetical protein Q9M18_07085 [Mariprofundaceae bacterium]|nr:hypothetical protein [Mariprofundaceae bacterium]